MEYTATKETLRRIDKITNGKHTTPDQRIRLKRIGDVATIFAKELATMCPESSELATALVGVQTAVVWANAAIRVNEDP